MYSRYSGISIPKNYGGSRFSEMKEPEMKSHRGEIGGATRSAHSPSFQAVTRQFEEETHNEADHIQQEAEPVLDSAFDSEDELNSEDVEKDCVKENAPDENVSSTSLSIKELFSHIDKEELIIIGLILLLMSDSSQKNDDIVAILILLLFNGKI